MDYDISHYTKEDLETMLHLPTNYDISIIDVKCNIMKNKIQGNTSIDETIKHNIISFLDEAKNSLEEGIEPYININQFVALSPEERQKFVSNISPEERQKLVSNLSPMERLTIASNLSPEERQKLASTFQQGSLNLNPTGNFQQAGLNPMELQKLAGNFQQERQKLVSNIQHGALNLHPLERKALASVIQPGTLNPIERKTVAAIVNIDTKFRNNYESTLSSDCSFDLPIRFPNVVTMELSTFEFPTLYYLTSLPGDNNYYFRLEINFVVKYVAIPSEIDNIIDVILYLNKQFKLIGRTDPKFAQLKFGLSVTNPATQSGVVTIENQSTPPIPFTLDFSALTQDNRPLSSNLGWLMGFRKAIYTNQTSYTSEWLANFLSDRYLFLVIDEYVNNKSDTFYSCYTSSLLNKNIIARISLRPNNTLAVVTEPRQYFGQVDLTKLKVQLLDEYGRPILYKNIDYSFCLKLNTVYNI